jgi:D-xylose transport system substrate-binding protein
MLALESSGRRLVFFLAAIFFPFVGFPSPQSQPAPVKLKIGFLAEALKGERWQTDLEKFKQRASELGAEVVVEDAGGDDDLQLRQAQQLLKEGVNSLVLLSHDTEKGLRIAAAAKESHVPLLCYERLVRSPDVSFFVGVDMSEVGYLEAHSLTQLAPKGNYVLIAGSPSDSNAGFLHKAQMEVLKPFVDRGDIKIVSDTWTKDWDQTVAYAHMKEAIESAKGNITAVIASNDWTAGGAIQALAEHNLAGKVLVSGQDADLEAIIHILEGSQTMTVYKPLGSQAKLAAEAAVSLAKREPAKHLSLVSSGGKLIPANLVVPVVVTKDNVMQTVIKDGFQNLETIQKSLPKDKWPH